MDKYFIRLLILRSSSQNERILCKLENKRGIFSEKNENIKIFFLFIKNQNVNIIYCALIKNVFYLIILINYL